MESKHLTDHVSIEYIKTVLTYTTPLTIGDVEYLNISFCCWASNTTQSNRNWKKLIFDVLKWTVVFCIFDFQLIVYSLQLKFWYLKNDRNNNSVTYLHKHHRLRHVQVYKNTIPQHIHSFALHLDNLKTQCILKGK